MLFFIVKVSSIPVKWLEPTDSDNMQPAFWFRATLEVSMQV